MAKSAAICSPSSKSWTLSSVSSVTQVGLWPWKARRFFIVGGLKEGWIDQVKGWRPRLDSGLAKTITVPSPNWNPSHFHASAVCTTCIRGDYIRKWSIHKAI